jgi:hypothetical protein
MESFSVMDKSFWMIEAYKYLAEYGQKGYLNPDYYELVSGLYKH